MTKCEFCDEISSKRGSRFDKIYGANMDSRVVLRTDRFVVLPTLGQLLTGSLLILPTRHVETCAQLNSDERAELSTIVNTMKQRSTQFGHPICFEHGASQVLGGSCGIYHAHMHIVPLPKRIEPRQLFPEYEDVANSLEASLSMLNLAQQYLLLSDGTQNLSLRLAGADRKYPSQFFRRRIVDFLGLERDWDWRNYKGVEPDVLNTIDKLAHKYA